MSSGVFWLQHAKKRSAGRLCGPADATPADQRAMDRALGLAERAAERGEVPVGAVVYQTRTGKTLAEAGNTRDGDRNPAGHAEFLAVLGAARARGDWRLQDCTLVVTLEPCAMCAGLIVNARVGRVVYGAKDPKAGFVGSLGNLLDDARLNHRVRAVAGVRESEASALLKAFFQRLRAGKGGRA